MTKQHEAATLTQRNMPEERNYLTYTKIKKIFKHYTRLSDGIYPTRSYQFKLGQCNKLTYRSTVNKWHSVFIRAGQKAKFCKKESREKRYTLTMPHSLAV